MYCDWPVLRKCCFCMPLRRGLLIFAYINILLDALMVGLSSYFIHCDDEFDMHQLNLSMLSHIPAKVSLAVYCIKFIFACFLIYGVHMKSTIFLKIFYYFAITTTVAVVIIQIVDKTINYEWLFFYMFQLVVFTFAGSCVNFYLIILIGSLLKKLELSDPHSYENQLQQFVSGEIKIQSDVVCSNSTGDMVEV